MGDLLAQYPYSMIVDLLWIVAQVFAVIVPLLIAVAYLTLAERRVIGLMQLRKGPNVVGPFGLFQPFADAIKLLAKETILPSVPWMPWVQPSALIPVAIR